MKRGELKALIKEVVQEMAYQPSRWVTTKQGTPWSQQQFKYVPGVPLNQQEQSEFKQAVEQAAKAIVDKYPDAKKYVENLNDVVKRLNIPKSWAIKAVRQHKKDYAAGKVAGSAKPTFGADKSDFNLQEGQNWEEYGFAVPKSQADKALALVKKIAANKTYKIKGASLDPTDDSYRVSGKDKKNWTDLYLTIDAVNGIDVIDVEKFLNKNGIETQ